MICPWCDRHAPRGFLRCPCCLVKQIYQDRDSALQFSPTRHVSKKLLPTHTCVNGNVNVCSRRFGVVCSSILYSYVGAPHIQTEWCIAAQLSSAFSPCINSHESFYLCWACVPCIPPPHSVTVLVSIGFSVIVQSDTNLSCELTPDQRIHPCGDTASSSTEPAKCRGNLEFVRQACAT